MNLLFMVAASAHTHHRFLSILNHRQHDLTFLVQILLPQITCTKIFYLWRCRLLFLRLSPSRSSIIGEKRNRKLSRDQTRLG
ncbi:hypothetical protein OIU84_003840 [Salix udensis]|uniref:Uncharacterized protein n=1 Tax=Salix udensis TaxID=889485 RepID=A0AAD6K169_9ROSI|nr:hypothetical protein OIU84_003840 [Salix udensis]